jgi:3-oxoacyl-[acyl-carrier-protein] synthase II
MSSRRVVVTGLGLISPVGNSVDEGWQNLLAGRSGIATSRASTRPPFSCRFAGEVKGFKVEDWFSAKDARHMDTFIHYGLAASIQAIRDAGLPTNEPARRGRGGADRLPVSSGIGGLPLIEETKAELMARGPRRVTPFFVPASIINMISGHVSIMFGFQGPNLAIVTACTTGLHSIGMAGRMIEHGDADVMIAGGAESTISPLGVGGFAAARALSTRNDDPATASRPGTRTATASSSAKAPASSCSRSTSTRSGAAPRSTAELVGFGMGADAFHMTGAERRGPEALDDRRAALGRASRPTRSSTSTPTARRRRSATSTRANAIKLAFGDHAKKLVVNSTKSMTGHLLGGAGGVESVFTVLAVKNQISPPTINIFNQDPECDLDYCANARGK